MVGAFCLRHGPTTYVLRGKIAGYIASVLCGSVVLMPPLSLSFRSGSWRDFLLLESGVERCNPRCRHKPTKMQDADGPQEGCGKKRTILAESLCQLLFLCLMLFLVDVSVF